MKLPVHFLKTIVAMSENVVSQDPTRYHLNHVLLEFRGGEMTIVAADGYCLVKAEYIGEFGIAGNWLAGEVEAANLKMQLKLLNKKQEDIELSFTVVDDKLVMQGDQINVTFIPESTVGRYPNWRVLASFDKDVINLGTICFNAALLARVVEVVCIGKKKYAKNIRLKFIDSNSAIRVESLDPELKHIKGLLMPVRG